MFASQKLSGPPTLVVMEAGFVEVIRIHPVRSIFIYVVIDTIITIVIYIYIHHDHRLVLLIVTLLPLECLFNMQGISI